MRVLVVNDTRPLCIIPAHCIPHTARLLMWINSPSAHTIYNSIDINVYVYRGIKSNILDYVPMARTWTLRFMLMIWEYSRAKNHQTKYVARALAHSDTNTYMMSTFDYLNN